MMYLFSGGMLTVSTKDSQDVVIDNPDDTLLFDNSNQTTTDVNYAPFYQGDVYQDDTQVEPSTARPSTLILIIALILMFLYAFFFVRKK